MTNNETLRILEWNIHFGLDVMTNGGVICKFSLLKNSIAKKNPGLLQKYQIKSFMSKGRLRRIIAWDMLIESLIKENTIKNYIV